MKELWKVSEELEDLQKKKKEKLKEREALEKSQTLTRKAELNKFIS